jgi:hypothetical protein
MFKGFQVIRVEIQRTGRQNVEMIQMGADQLDFPDASFDWVLCGFALWFFRLCCTNRSASRLTLHPFYLAHRIGLRPPKFQHPIEQLAGKRSLPLLRFIPLCP